MSGVYPVVAAEAVGSVGRAAGYPENIVVSVVVGRSSQNEEQVGESVEIDEQLWIDGFRFRDPQHFGFGTSADGPCQVQCGCRL